MSEWFIEPVSKTGVPLAGTAGSNPALSVIEDSVGTSFCTCGTCNVFSVFDCPIALERRILSSKIPPNYAVICKSHHSLLAFIIMQMII